jgi:hypothetical protein
MTKDKIKIGDWITWGCGQVAYQVTDLHENKGLTIFCPKGRYINTGAPFEAQLDNMSSIARLTKGIVATAEVWRVEAPEFIRVTSNMREALRKYRQAVASVRSEDIECIMNDAIREIIREYNKAS